MLHIRATLAKLDRLAKDITWETPQSGEALQELLAELREQIETALRAQRRNQ